MGAADVFGKVQANRHTFPDPQRWLLVGDSEEKRADFSDAEVGPVICFGRRLTVTRSDT